MRHESIGAVHTHTHTHTHGIVLVEEKRVDEICSKSAVLECRYALEILIAAIAFGINLIFSISISRLLFSKQNDLLLKSNFLYIRKIRIKIKNFFNKVKIQNHVFEEITISRLSQFVC